MPLITIIPFEYINNEVIGSIKDIVSKTFNSTVNIYPRKVSLSNCRKRDEQLNAEDFLPAIDRLVEDYGLGITNQDLYVPNLNFVFGVAFGKNCIISSARLKGDLFLKRVTKEAVHEIGHCFGLSHCNNRKCVMYFSNSLYDSDVKEEKLCGECKEKIRK